MESGNEPELCRTCCCLQMHWSGSVMRPRWCHRCCRCRLRSFQAGNTRRPRRRFSWTLRFGHPRLSHSLISLASLPARHLEMAQAMQQQTQIAFWCHWPHSPAAVQGLELRKTTKTKFHQPLHLTIISVLSECTRLQACKLLYDINDDLVPVDSHSSSHSSVTTGTL